MAISSMSKLLILPKLPKLPIVSRRKRDGSSDARYLDGQRLIVQAMRYLVKEGPGRNREAIQLLSEHFRTQFRMSDRPPLHP